ncbi:substrate-binding domain-containing protein [Rhizobium sp. SL86]|nr:substrate-binding domain-containing protein [Rhizobium sp. SL86]
MCSSAGTGLRQADGIIVLGHAGRFPSTVSRSSPEHNLPIVVCGEVTDPQLLKYPRFQIDGHAAAMELTEHLIRCGHKKIAFMRGEIPLLKMNARETGYRTAMQAAGLEVDPAWLVDGYLTVEGGQRAVADLLALKDRPSALICANDEMALGAMGELTHRGLSAPEDLSIAGFDNTRYSRIWNPALTTIAQPAEEMGERAMHCLLRMIEGHEITTEVEYFAHQLIIRKSVKNLE